MDTLQIRRREGKAAWEMLHLDPGSWHFYLPKSQLMIHYVKYMEHFEHKPWGKRKRQT